MRVERLLTRLKPPRRPVLVAQQLSLLVGSRESPAPVGALGSSEDEPLRRIVFEGYVEFSKIGSRAQVLLSDADVVQGDDSNLSTGEFHYMLRKRQELCFGGCPMAKGGIEMVELLQMVYSLGLASR